MNSDLTPVGDMPSSAPIPSMGAPTATLRTFMIAITTDRGPKLLSFRLSNLLIGRLPDNHLGINHGSVSRRHAKIDVTQRGVFIEDLGSQNGVTVNGVITKGSVPIRPGDILRIGHVPIYYFGFINPEAPPTPDFVDSSMLVTPVLPAIT